MKGTDRSVVAVVVAVAGASQCRSVKKVKVGPPGLTKTSLRRLSFCCGNRFPIPVAGEARNTTGSIARGTI